MLKNELVLNPQDKEILIAALDLYLEDLESERKSYPSVTDVINSGIMLKINTCKATLNSVKKDAPLKGIDILNIYLALTSYCELCEEFVDNSPLKHKNAALDMRKISKNLLSKFKPLYVQLASEQ